MKRRLVALVGLASAACGGNLAPTPDAGDVPIASLSPSDAQRLCEDEAASAASQLAPNDLAAMWCNTSSSVQLGSPTCHSDYASCVSAILPTVHLTPPECDGFATTIAGCASEVTTAVFQKCAEEQLEELKNLNHDVCDGNQGATEYLTQDCIQLEATTSCPFSYFLGVSTQPDDVGVADASGD